MARIVVALCFFVSPFFPERLRLRYPVNIPLTPGPQALKEQQIEGQGTAKILLLDITGMISERDKEQTLLGVGQSIHGGVRPRGPAKGGTGPRHCRHHRPGQFSRRYDNGIGHHLP